jgi:hypothetical protein
MKPMNETKKFNVALNCTYQKVVLTKLLWIVLFITTFSKAHTHKDAWDCSEKTFLVADRMSDQNDNRIQT